MARYKTPKGCIVSRVELSGGASPYAEIGYRCSAPGNRPTSTPYDEHGRTGPFKREDGAQGTYPSKLVRGVRALSFRGMTVSGSETHAGFVLSPAAAVCQKDAKSATLSCKLIGDTSSPSLSGAKHAKRAKRRRR